MEADRCVSQLFKDCLRLADYLGNQVSCHRVRISVVAHLNLNLTRVQGGLQKGNNAVLREQVRTQFRANLKEEDPVKIKDQKSA